MTHRITRSRLAWLASQLSDHAHTVTRILSDQRFATTRQLARFLRPAFQSDTSALRQTNRLMGMLQENALVKTLQRRVFLLPNGNRSTQTPPPAWSTKQPL